uniref:Sulfotransferase n=1 Tax=Aegilops tauschii subsp. strangulata TaxID=200361 RepID=A0A453LJ34_AEGTS
GVLSPILVVVCTQSRRRGSVPQRNLRPTPRGRVHVPDDSEAQRHRPPIRLPPGRLVRVHAGGAERHGDQTAPRGARHRRPPRHLPQVRHHLAQGAPVRGPPPYRRRRDRLAAHSPHQLVPFLEARVFTNGRIPDLSSLPAPRLLMTHIPSVSLPESVAASGCKVVYRVPVPGPQGLPRVALALLERARARTVGPGRGVPAVLRRRVAVRAVLGARAGVLALALGEAGAGAVPDLRGARRGHARPAEAPRGVRRTPVHGGGAGGGGGQGDRGGLRHGEPGGAGGEPVWEDRHGRVVGAQQRFLQARRRWGLQEPPDAGDGEEAR